MGVVHQAYDPQLRREVAIKMIRAGAFDQERERRRFEREARATARLRHPGIVAVHEVGEERGCPYIVMDYVDGETLEAMHQRARPSARRVAAILRLLADALQHAHDHGVVHRDLKPQNVIVDRDGQPHIVDFGLARTVEASSDLTKTGHLIGTPQFVAPEQARGDRGRMGPRSDVYALGGVLYWALTGRPPADGDTVLGVIHDVLVRDPPAPRSIDPSIPQDLETIALRCLEKDPGRRYPSARAVAAELGRHLDGEPILARPLGPLDRLRRWTGRNRALAALIGVVVLVVTGAVFGGLALVGEMRRRDTERDAEVARARSETERVRREVTGGATGGPGDDAASPEATEGGAPRSVAAVLDEVRSGRVAASAGGFDEALFRLVRSADAPSAAALARELDVLAERLETITIAVCLGAAPPNELERGRGESEIAGVAAAFEELFSLPPGGKPTAASAEIVARVRDRLARRAKSARPEEAIEVDGLAVAQTEALGENDAILARLCCEALGRIAHAGSVPALGRYLRVESDPLRAAAAGIALCQIGGPDAEKLVLASMLRFGPNGAYWRRVSRSAEKIGISAAGALAGATGSHTVRGFELLTKGDLAGAIAAFDAAIAEDPSRSDAWTNRGTAKLKNGDWTGAIADFDRSIELRPDVAITWGNRGLARKWLGDASGAMADLDRAIALDPADSSYWNNRGTLKLALRDVAGGEADLRRAIELDGNNSAAWASLGQALALLGEVGEAREALDHAIAIDPNLGEAWVNRGTLRIGQNDLEGGLADFDRAIELLPNVAILRYNRAVMRLKRGDAPGAIADLDRAIEVDPKFVHAWIWRGMAHAERGANARAIADIEEGLRLDPNVAGAASWREKIVELRAGR